MHKENAARMMGMQMDVESKTERKHEIQAANLMQIYGLNAQEVALILDETVEWADSIAVRYDMPERTCPPDSNDTIDTWSMGDYLTLSQDELERKAEAFEYMIGNGADYRKLARALHLPEVVALSWKTQLMS